MATAKVAVTIETKLLAEIDHWVAKFPPDRRRSAVSRDSDC